MTDSVLLTSKISECGYTYSEIANELGITRQGLWKKIHNRSEFKQSEIEKITRLLNLSMEVNSKIFFKNSVGNMTTKE
ncbi:helix-turn-helix domain-containing protein [Ruminococcus sp.]|uniref:helix-turn-helix domain-containing protein n=1 Tax=Ruminococcus sp. TaxID=41978 RepID=UPI003864638E